MRPLIITKEIREQVREIANFARSNEYHPGKSETIPGNDPRHVLLIPHGYRCVFSITVDKDNGRWRHLSISVQPLRRDKYPHPFAAFEIAKLFGLTGAKSKDQSFPEDWLFKVRPDEGCVMIGQKL